MKKKWTLIHNSSTKSFLHYSRTKRSKTQRIARDTFGIYFPLSYPEQVSLKLLLVSRPITINILISATYKNQTIARETFRI